MASRLRRNQDFLKVLSRAKPNQRNALLKTCDREYLLTLCEICDNALRGNLPLNKKQLCCLKKHSEKIRKVASKRYGIKAKRKVLSQQGGFLAALLPAAIGLIASLVTK